MFRAANLAGIISALCDFAQTPPHNDGVFSSLPTFQHLFSFSIHLVSIYLHYSQAGGFYSGGARMLPILRLVHELLAVLTSPRGGWAQNS